MQGRYIHMHGLYSHDNICPYAYDMIIGGPYTIIYGPYMIIDGPYMIILAHI